MLPPTSSDRLFAGRRGKPKYTTEAPATVMKPTTVATSKPLEEGSVSEGTVFSGEGFSYGAVTFFVVSVMMMTYIQKGIRVSN